MRTLREKYAEMRALREADAHADVVDPRPRLRALAARFPGALRELDELPLDVIVSRLAELEAVERGELPVPRWARAQCLYHGWMRAALGARRAAGRDRDRGRAARWIETQHRPGDDDPSVDALAQALDGVLRPPHGRLNQWAFERVAEELATDRADVERLLFPYAHRSVLERSSGRT